MNPVWLQLKVLEGAACFAYFCAIETKTTNRNNLREGGLALAKSVRGLQFAVVWNVWQRPHQGNVRQLLFTQ